MKVMSIIGIAFYSLTFFILNITSLVSDWSWGNDSSGALVFMALGTLYAIPFAIISLVKLLKKRYNMKVMSIVGIAYYFLSFLVLCITFVAEDYICSDDWILAFTFMILGTLYAIPYSIISLVRSKK